MFLRFILYFAQKSKNFCSWFILLKTKIYKPETFFFENIPLNVDEEVPYQDFLWVKAFSSKSCQKIFSLSGPKKSMIVCLFSKIDIRNFDQFRKNVFFETSFFSENRGNRGYFWARSAICFYFSAKTYKYSALRVWKLEWSGGNSQSCRTLL